MQHSSYAEKTLFFKKSNKNRKKWIEIIWVGYVSLLRINVASVLLPILIVSTVSFYFIFIFKFFISGHGKFGHCYDSDGKL